MKEIDIMKRISTALPLALAALALVSLWGTSLTAESQDGKQPADSTANAVSEIRNSDTATVVPEAIAYYFHTTYRCASCKKIEAYSKEAIETGFAEELKSGALKFESINIEEEGNEHFIEDYQLYTKSLIICDMKDGKQVRWKNLNKIWELIGNKDEFVQYVQAEIKTYLKAD
jgi:hypothetical protein